MKTRINFLLFLSFILLISCGKKIDGTIKDNFGNPIEGVDVKIYGSDFKAVTNNSGHFSLDYAPGEINLTLDKKGYVSIQRDLTITEKSNYPLGLVEMWKQPDSIGLYLICEKQYVCPKLIRLIEQKETRGNYMFRTTSTLYKLPEKIKYKFVEVIKTENIKIGVYMLENIFEPVIVNDRLVSIEDAASFNFNVRAQYVNSTQKEIDKAFIVREIPKKNNLYCLIPVNRFYNSSTTKNYGFCFKVSNDSLFIAQ